MTSLTSFNLVLIFQTKNDTFSKHIGKARDQFSSDQGIQKGPSLEVHGYFDTAHSLFRHCTRGGMGPMWQIAIWQTKWHHIICWRMEIVDQVHVLDCFRYKCKLIANCRLQKHTNSYIYWAKPTAFLCAGFYKLFLSNLQQTYHEGEILESCRPPAAVSSHGDPLVGDVKNDFVPAPKRRWVRLNE